MFSGLNPYVDWVRGSGWWVVRTKFLLQNIQAVINDETF